MLRLIMMIGRVCELNRSRAATKAFLSGASTNQIITAAATTRMKPPDFPLSCYFSAMKISRSGKQLPRKKL